MIPGFDLILILPRALLACLSVQATGYGLSFAHSAHPQCRRK